VQDALIMARLVLHPSPPRVLALRADLISFHSVFGSVVGGNMASR